MKKKKSTSDISIADKDREAISKAALALSAFEESDQTEEISEDMEIWNEASEEESQEEEIQIEMESSDEVPEEMEAAAPVEGTELEEFESAEIEDLEFVSE